MRRNPPAPWRRPLGEAASRSLGRRVRLRFLHGRRNCGPLEQLRERCHCAAGLLLRGLRRGELHGQLLHVLAILLQRPRRDLARSLRVLQRPPRCLSVPTPRGLRFHGGARSRNCRLDLGHTARPDLLAGRDHLAKLLKRRGKQVVELLEHEPVERAALACGLRERRFGGRKQRRIETQVLPELQKGLQRRLGGHMSALLEFREVTDHHVLEPRLLLHGPLRGFALLLLLILRDFQHPGGVRCRCHRLRQCSARDLERLGP
mmetsp:Transcript_7419/g.21044  ORF Transcript_7419/g.21044 Transcript_7419/m.21044 type:complete len:261 (-) Transcript_7419:457-1239(-)